MIPRTRSLLSSPPPPCNIQDGLPCFTAVYLRHAGESHSAKAHWATKKRQLGLRRRTVAVFQVLPLKILQTCMTSAVSLLVCKFALQANPHEPSPVVCRPCGHCVWHQALLCASALSAILPCLPRDFWYDETCYFAPHLTLFRQLAAGVCKQDLPGRGRH